MFSSASPRLPINESDQAGHPLISQVIEGGANMVIPIIASTSRDLIRGLPIPPWKGAGALGMPDAETFCASPGKAQVYLSYDPALLFVMVLIVIIPGRVAVSLSRRHAG